MAVSSQDVQFNLIEIHKGDENLLGIWSYGNIYKATCDYLPCAAKVLHPILFQTSNPQVLYQEVASLQDLRHPNIVQHLGCYQDPKTNLPVLFTELVDESLTLFLSRSRIPLPYHTQLDLSHEVALALAYLHTRKLIHCNLSGSSVMLVNNRAKVTDFAVSKLEEASKSSRQRFPLTKEEFYLPPEALKKVPIFSIKTDSFSFGVLLVQVITRLYPTPGDEMEIVDDPQAPLGVLYKPVTELQRRKNHISLVGEHSLMPIITKCLAFKAEDRPCAGELCQKTSKLKGMDQYQKSKKKHLKARSDEDTDEVPDDFNVKGWNKHQKSIDQEQYPKQQEFDFTWQPADDQADDQVNYSNCTVSIIDSDTIYFSDYGEYIYAFHIQEKKWSKIHANGKCNYAIAIIEGMLTTIGGSRKGDGLHDNSLYSLLSNDTETQKWVQYYPPLKSSQQFPAAAVYKDKFVIVCSTTSNTSYTLHSLNFSGTSSVSQSHDSTELLYLTQGQKQWLTVEGLQFPYSKGSAIIIDDALYLLPKQNSLGLREEKSVLSCSVKDLLAYDGRELEWRHHAEPPMFASGYAAVSGRLLAFGGQEGNDQYLHSKKTTNNVYQYDPESDSWQVIGQMPNARSHACVTVLPNNKLLVVGGSIMSNTLEPVATTIIDSATYTLT